MITTLSGVYRLSAYITIRNELSKTLRLTTILFFYQKVAHSANYVSATYVPI